MVSGAARNFWHLFAARVALGAGEAGCIPPAQSMICDYVSLKRRPAVFAIHNCGLVVGMTLSSFIYHRRLWAKIIPADTGVTVHLGGTTHKSQIDFQKEFKKLTDKIQA